VTDEPDEIETDTDVDDWMAQAGLPSGTPRPITVQGTAVLHRPCRPVTSFDLALKQLVADMFASMVRAEGVGLAANQIGVDARIFVYDCPDAEDDYQVGCVINPTVFIPPGDIETDDGDEGCLSVPGPFAPLPRPSQAYVLGQDLDGNPIRVDGTGLLARCLQHETDHLNGIIYLDHLDEQARSTVLAEAAEIAASGEIPAWSAAFTGSPNGQKP
jgi:peptide deformylase